MGTDSIKLLNQGKLDTPFGTYNYYFITDASFESSIISQDLTDERISFAIHIKSGTPDLERGFIFLSHEFITQILDPESLENYSNDTSKRNHCKICGYKTHKYVRCDKYEPPTVSYSDDEIIDLIRNPNDTSQINLCIKCCELLHSKSKNIYNNGYNLAQTRLF